MEELPTPLLMNPLKHHFPCLINEILQVKDEKDLIAFTEKLKKTGHGIMDLYIGDLSLKEIAIFVKKHLQEMKVFQPASYTAWITQQEANYRIVAFPDGSKWTFRLGNEPQRYIHIHPCRYAENTLRVRAPSVKTAAGVFARLLTNPDTKLSLDLINDTRNAYLNLSPVKKIDYSKGTGKMIRIIENKISVG